MNMGINLSNPSEEKNVIIGEGFRRLIIAITKHEIAIKR